MKIGIITWFYYENYGTKLQAIALQKYLRGLGHYVELLNFQVKDSDCNFNHKNKKPLCIKVYNKSGYYLLKYFRHRYQQDFEKRTNEFIKVINENCNVSNVITNDKEYISTCNRFDVLVFGSDQIWNPNWYHRYYYADFPEITCKRISYAPSIGVNHIPDERKNDIKRSLSRFEFLSLREEQGCESINEILGKRPELVVDPTFLIDAKDWSLLASATSIYPKPYVLCYFLTDNNNHWRAARKFAASKKLQIRIIPQQGFSYIQPGVIEKTASVYDFINLIKNAKYIITDSFHASVFSMIFNKTFVVFERSKPDFFSAQNSRIYNLLEKTSLKEYLLKYNSNTIVNIKDPDYSKVNYYLKLMIDSSKKYLKEALDIYEL